MLDLTFAWGELRLLASLMWAMVITTSLYSLIFPTALAFCSGLGKEAFDSASLAISLFQSVIVSAASGMRWGSLSTFSQTLGGGMQKRVGTQLQRSLLIGLALSAISISLALNSGNLLALVGQLPRLAAGAEMFLIVMIPGCVSLMVYRILMALTDSMRVVIPTLLVSALGFVINLALHFVTVMWLGLGLVGSALSMSCTIALMLLAQAVYVWRSGIARDAWSGWSLRCFLRLGEVCKDLLPSVGFSVLEFFGFELGSLLAGTVDTTALAAHSILFQSLSIAVFIPVGLECAVISRIAFHLGHGSPKEAKTTLVLGLLVQSAVALVTVAVFASLVHEIPKLFAADAATKELYLESFPLMLLFVVLVMMTYAMVAGLRALNYQTYALVNSLFGFYVVFLPVSICLLKLTRLGLMAVWIGYVCCMSVQLMFAAGVILRVDWTARSTSIHDQAGEETEVEDYSNASETKPLLAKSLDGDAADPAQTVALRHIRGRLLLYCAVFLLLPLAVLLHFAVPLRVPMQPLGNASLPVVNASANFDIAY